MNEKTTTRPSRCDGIAPSEEACAQLERVLIAESMARYAQQWPCMSAEQQRVARIRAVTDAACEIARRQGISVRVHNHHTAQALIDRML